VYTFVRAAKMPVPVDPDAPQVVEKTADGDKPPEVRA
jgi:hypothetical protein